MSTTLTMPRTPSVTRSQRGWRLAAVTAVVAGGALRIVQWWSAPSLWLDESMIALNILERDLVGLTQALTFGQVAPIGWLWLERLAVLALGEGERALRFVPLLAGLATLVLAWRVGARLAGPAAGATAAAFVAAWPATIRYASELKPYGLDAAVALAVWLAVARLLDDERHAWPTLAAVGAFGTAVSLPAPITLGAAVLTILAARRDRVTWTRLSGTVAVWAAALAGVTLVSVRQVAASPIVDYWLAEEGGGSSLLRSWWLTFVELLAPIGRITTVAFVLGMILGTLVLVRWHRAGWLFPLAVGGALAADLLGLYPFATGRVTLFLTTLALVAVAGAVAGGAHLAAAPRAAAPLRLGGGLAGALVLIGVVWVVGVRIAAFDPSPQREEARPVLASVAEQAVPGDVLVALQVSDPAIEFYDRRLDLPPLAGKVVRAPDRAGCPRPQLGGAGRVWLVTTHHSPGLGLSSRAQADVVAALGDPPLRVGNVVATLLPDGLPDELAGAPLCEVPLTRTLP